MADTFKSQTTLTVDDKRYQICQLDPLNKEGKVDQLPFTLRILLENLLRHEDGESVFAKDIEAIVNWNPHAEPSYEIAFSPARVILQDFTGVPAVVDLAAMRDAMATLGGDIQKINPLTPVELVIDHSVMVDHFGSKTSLSENINVEYQRNTERYKFLRWGQQAFENFRVVPPGTGIVHQVNLEYLARVVFDKQDSNNAWAYPDTVVGTDSHTTMINGLGVLAWGVGGIEAEAAMLGQPITMLIPQVVGFKLSGQLPEGVTATDLVLTIVEILRKEGVVGKFVEFFGAGLANLPLADRATIANMAPEYGATCGFFPIDEETLNFMRLTGRAEAHIKTVEMYAKKQHLFHDATHPEPNYTKVLTLDLNKVVASIAGPKRPQDRISLTDAKQAFTQQLKIFSKDRLAFDAVIDDKKISIPQGAVFIAAITSCTNTSNPAVMLAAGLLAKKAVEKGLSRKPWVKTSLAPGSQVVTDYLVRAAVMKPMESLGFNLVGYGCTTCIGNSGPLVDNVNELAKSADMLSSAVLSGNRNFEGRIHPSIRNAYLASPPLVVAYALAGTMNIDLLNEPLGSDATGAPVYLKDVWPSAKEVQDAIHSVLSPDMFKKRYASVFAGDKAWLSMGSSNSPQYAWENDSTYIQNPPYFEGMKKIPAPVKKIQSAHLLALLGDSVTTDHISPAGSIAQDSPAGRYLTEQGVKPIDFNSYGSRRGNHQVMMRGTFANIRLKNQLAPGTEGSWTVHFPSAEKMSIYDAAMRYQGESRSLMVIAGKEYGMGSSRDWAAKGAALLGIRAVIAESFERIHRSNLIGMGVLPLQFLADQSAASLSIRGDELFDIQLDTLKPKGRVIVSINSKKEMRTFEALVRIDTPKEMEYFRNGGILPFVIRQLLAQ